MNIGTFEGPSMLRPNRHVRDILFAKGYDVTYSEYHGGHETACLRDTLPDGLLALTRDWR
jgi:enterochelin esterase family protein